MPVLRYLLVQNKLSSFKYFFTAGKETEESNVISQELFIYWLVERAVWKNHPGNLSVK